MNRIYDRAEIIGYIEEEILAEGTVPYRFVREAKNSAYKDQTAYNLMLEFMILPSRRKYVLRVLESYLKREGKL